MSHRSLVAAAAASAMLAMLSACGGEVPAAPAAGETPAGEMPDVQDDQLKGFVEQVNDMGVMEWRGQLLTKSPSHGGKRIFELSGRYSTSTGYSSISMDSAINGVKEKVDYLVMADRTYFNSDAWGPGASECWADITGDTARTWGLPTQLDPTWPVSAARAVGVSGDGVAVEVPAKAVITGMPRGLFPAVPEGLKGVNAKATIIPHGPLLEVRVDVANMWADVPDAIRPGLDTKKTGWWDMTMQEARDGTSVKPPAHIFDPTVTPPSQCMKA